MEVMIVGRTARPDRFTATLESNGQIALKSTKQPLFEGARLLLEHGFDPETLLTVRHEGAEHASFIPAPIGSLALWRVKEGEKTSIRLEKWSPYGGETEE